MNRHKVGANDQKLVVVNGKDKVRLERGIDQSEQVTLRSTFRWSVESDTVGLWCFDLRPDGRMSNAVVVSSDISHSIQQDTGLIECFENGVESTVVP